MFPSFLVGALALQIHEQGPEQVRPAALVLLLRSLAVLVRPDGDVLGAVVRRDVTAAQRERRRRNRQEAARELLCRRAELRVAHEPDDNRGAEHRREHDRTLERQPSLRQCAPDLRDDRDRVGQPCGAAEQRTLDLGAAETLLARDHFQLALAGAHRARPRRRPVHEYAVGECHPAETDLFLAHEFESSDCAQCRRKLTPSSRSSTGTRSSAEWISRAAVSIGSTRDGKKP